MPTYEYECKNCGNAFEVFQGMNDKPIKTCPACKGKVQKIISAGVGVIFKGSGFYETDYKRKGTSCSAKSDLSSKDKTSSSSHNDPASKTTCDKAVASECPKAASCPAEKK
jgi:putative FmdB family regulatory protein